jgi:hypothetical protein
MSSPLLSTTQCKFMQPHAQVLVHAFKPGVPGPAVDEGSFFRPLLHAAATSAACGPRVAKCHGLTLLEGRVALVTQHHDWTLEGFLAARGCAGGVYGRPARACVRPARLLLQSHMRLTGTEWAWLLYRWHARMSVNCTL